MNIHLKIKECVDKKGADVIVTNTLIGMLDDEQVFDDIESVPYKKILRSIIKDGYAQKLVDLGSYSSEVKLLASQYANANLMQEAPVLYVLDCLAFGLGWTNQEPCLQTPPSQTSHSESPFPKQEAKKEGFLSRITGFLKNKNNNNAQNAEDYYQKALLSKQAGNIEAYLEGLKNAANKGHGEACLTLGIAYYYGDNAVQDYEEALTWFKKGANKGNEACFINLGFMYAEGKGVGIDYNKAMRYFEKPAKTGIGNARAQYGMGYCYYKLLETYHFNLTNESLKCYAETERWLLQAAKKGFANAQFLLAELYLFPSAFYSNVSAKEQHRTAHDWLLKAAAQGHQNAQKELARFKGAFWK